jgi:hypothetical protein
MQFVVIAFLLVCVAMMVTLQLAYLCLPDRPRSIHIHDDRVVRVDEIIVRIGKECWAFARRCPLAGRVRVSGKLGCDLTGCAKSLIVQNVEILAHGAWRVIAISFSGHPVFGVTGILLLNICTIQTGIHCKTLTAYKSFLHAARNCHLEHLAQKITLAEPAVPVLGKGGMIWNAVGQIEATKPSVC